jgi:hypothetical protein
LARTTTHVWSRAAAALTLGLLLLPAAIAAADPAPGERARLRERFDALDAVLLDSTLSTPVSNAQGQLAWQVALQMSALAEMLEATRDTVYAGRLVRLADAVAAERDDLHGRADELRHHVLKGWGARKYSKNQRAIWAVHTALITAPMARFAALVRADPAWRARYGAAAERLLRVARESMQTHDSEYRTGPEPDEGRLLWFGESLPFNQQSLVGRAWLYIDEASDEPPYRDRLACLARFLRAHLRMLPDSAIVWSYWTPRSDPYPDAEDASHAAHSADFLLLCEEAAIEFTPADARALERTFLDHVVQPADSIATTVAGGRPLHPPTTAILLWGRLARHSPRARDTLLRLYHDETFRADSRHAELLGLAYLIAALSAATR